MTSADRPDRAYDREARDESAVEQLDRNWGDLLQELRVTQTGVQLLTGFLLTLPFQQRFTTLDAVQRSVYLATVSVSVLATGLLVAPVGLHRLTFRRRVRRETVAVAHRLALAGLACLGLATVGVVLLTFDVVVSRAAGVVAAVVLAVVLVALWLVLPRTVLARAHPVPEPPPRR